MILHGNLEDGISRGPLRGGPDSMTIVTLRGPLRLERTRPNRENTVRVIKLNNNSKMRHQASV
jgi:hypothetical protein